MIVAAFMAGLGLGSQAGGIPSSRLTPSRALWSRLHGLRGERAYLAEDASGVVAIKEQIAGYWYVLVDGKGHSWVPFNGVHTWLGAMPALVHPRPSGAARRATTSSRPTRSGPGARTRATSTPSSSSSDARASSSRAG
jgi:hypothetical protein